ncbi:MAG: MFS transporter [Alicyclobacillus sp.]|nr:MFS transporter [Alicyclobacillus sp.]
MDPTVVSATDEQPIVRVRNLRFQPVTYAWMITIIGLIGYLFTTFDTSIFGASLPSIAADFKISGSTISYLMAGIFAFGAISGFVLGPVADRMGRKPTFQMILAATGIFSGLTAFVGNLGTLTFVRLISGVGINATSPINTLISEEAPPDKRGMMMGIMQAGFPLGSAIAGTVAAIFLMHWRPLFLIAFAPVLVILAVSVLVRESPRFQLVAEERKAGRGKRAGSLPINVQEAGRNEVAQMFARGIRRQSVVVTVFNFLAPAGVVMVATFVTLYATEVQHFSVGQAAMLLAINNWVALVAQVAVGFLSDYIPPKWIQVVGAMVGALTPLLMANAGGSYAVDVIAMVVYGLFGNGLYGCNFRYAGESFPTRIRATGIFFAQAAVDAMFVVLPLLAGVFFAAQHPADLLWIIFAAQILAGIVMLFGKDIRPGHTLEEINGEI